MKDIVSWIGMFYNPKIREVDALVALSAVWVKTPGKDDLQVLQNDPQ